jgi:hypothetical protein
MPRVAINICDLDALVPRGGGFNPVAMLLHDFCTKDSPTVMPTGMERWDDAAIILDGPAAQDEARVEAVVELLQTVIGPRKIHRRVRCYREGPRGGWPQIMPKKKERDHVESAVS